MTEWKKERSEGEEGEGERGEWGKKTTQILSD